MVERKTFEKVLIANRGEIALRIITTLQKMGIKSVAVYSEADTNSEYVQQADEAYYIGNSPATESYLSIPNIIRAIRLSGADAVHPGYGFLSENPDFANKLYKEGITLIGPSAEIIHRMGDKVEAKKIAIDSDVNTVPGYIGVIDTLEQATSIAKDIGFPIIIKAAAGGGGRGMRVVHNETEMANAYNSAKLEAANNFSDSRVFIEKLIQSPRHIEIQLLADQYGNAICLGERECSIQRYHQKVIEEAPSSFINEQTRQKMYDQVMSLSKKVGYYSAGTVEFMVDQDCNFYFLEMNTRLQVEHPITELITDIDLVEQMIRIARGESLSITQDEVKLNGWAFEARICAEDPSRGFLPSSGRILEYREPPKSPNIRVDSGVSAGGEISMFYDPMIAKLCTYGKTREEAIKQMSLALSTFVLQGISHNITFLEAIINHQKFIDGNIHTGFIDEEYPDGFSGAKLTSDITMVFLASAVFASLTEQKRMSSVNDQITDQACRIGTRWIVRIDGTHYPVMIKEVEDGYNIRNDFNRINIRSKWNLGAHLLVAKVNELKVNVKIENILTGYKLTHKGITVDAYVRSPRMSELEALMPDHDDISMQTELIAPLSGQIIDIKVSAGDEVKIGDELIILTAMKMENIITAERSGKISKILVDKMSSVTSGQKLLEFE